MKETDPERSPQSVFFIRISLPAALVIGGYILLYPTLSTLTTILAILIHESGHILMLMICREPIDGMRITPFGLIISRRQRICPPSVDLAVYLAGPLLGLTVALLFSGLSGSFWAQFSEYNFFFGLLNLLPIRSLDGGRAIGCLASVFFTDRVAEKIERLLSLATLCLLWLISVYDILMGFGGTSLLLLSVWLFFSLFLKEDVP